MPKQNSIITHRLLLFLLAFQFVLANLLTGPLFGDAARNLHWGLITAENPQFMLGALDTFERIKGFPPNPPTLAPMGLTGGQPGGFHRWWGPLAPLLFAGVWKLTGSYTLLQLVIPLAGAATVLLTYLLARDMLGTPKALLAAAFLACFPIFREYASTSYTEALSALVVTAALLCYRRGNLWATIVLGTLTVLTKMDLYPLFAGAVIGAILAESAKRKAEPQNQEPRTKSRAQQQPCNYHSSAIERCCCAPPPFTNYQLLLTLFIPLLLASPWIWLHYLNEGSGGPTRGLSAGLFAILAPQLLELLFYIPWYGAMIVLAAIGFAVWAGLRASILSACDTGLLLGWLAVGFLIVLVYAATPGAGNSPRVIIPALPALAILFAAGFATLHANWRRRIGFFLVVLFLLINLVTLYFDSASGIAVRQYMPAWDVLRSRPQGYVLTEKYWETILFSRQQATWFEADKTFETNIMQNAANFATYVEQNPIRYVLLPRIGSLASVEVRAYLDTMATRVEAGEIVVYELKR